MKTKIAFLFLMTFASVCAQANTYTCANAQLYFSQIRYGGGVAPRPGTKIGSTILVYQGKLKMNVDRLAGQNPVLEPYQFELSGKEETLEEKGNQVSGSKVYKDTATVYKVSKTNPNQRQVIIEGEEVVCSQTWELGRP